MCAFLAYYADAISTHTHTLTQVTGSPVHAHLIETAKKRGATIMIRFSLVLVIQLLGTY